MNSVIEMVSFKLAAGVTKQDLLTATEESHAAVAKWDGFQYRSLSYNEELQTWTDIVYWQSMETAQAAAEAFIHCAACQALAALVDKDTVIMQHQHVHFSSCDAV